MRDPIEEAVRVLHAGGLVAFPTETVYGLGADARSPSAIGRVFAAKGRPAAHPLIVHLPSAQHLDRWALEVPSVARRLAERFWPGALTLVLRKRDDVPGEVTGGQDTVALRVPDHPLALALLRAFDGGLAAPSANRFGNVSPTTAQHVRDELGDRVDLVLDGGPCRVGLESTIVDLSGDEPRLLRPGGVPREAIEAITGPLHRPTGRVRAPGTLPSHYAPRAEVRAVARSGLASTIERAVAAGERAVLLAPAEDAPPGIDVIALPDALEERARRLYAALREVDARGFEVAIVALTEQPGLGVAIDDRLRRASARRTRQAP